MKKIEMFWLILLVGSALAGGFSVGLQMGSSVENARKIVIRDNIEHQKFDAEYQKAMHPDFLTALGGKDGK